MVLVGGWVSYPAPGGVTSRSFGERNPAKGDWSLDDAARARKTERTQSPVKPVPRRMRVLAFLPDDSFIALKRSLGPRDAVGRLTDAASLSRSSSLRADAIVIDPTCFDDEQWTKVRQFLITPDTPVLLYARLDKDSVRRIVAASSVGVHELLLREVDDDPVAIRRRLESLRRPPAPVRVLARLAPRIAEMPAPLQGAALPLFCAAPVPRWADDLALAARMSRRSMDRWMDNAGLAGTAALLDVARLARVWEPIVEEKVAPADVAIAGGYRRLRMLALHSRRLVGVSPALLAKEVSEDEFVDRLVLYATRR
jgi:hypothetical protein